MRIGILQTGHVPDDMRAAHGDYGAMFRQLLDGHGFAFDVYSVIDGHFPADIGAADGWLITGSRHGAYEDRPWIARLEEFLRQAFQARIPIVGICFGHQILAQALGGRVEKFDGGWSVGPARYALSGKDAAVTMNAWHQDQVVSRPEGAKVLASSDSCENAILAYGDRALTIQAHPEIQPDFLRGLIEKRGRGVVPDALLDAASAKLETPLSTAWAIGKMADFFNQPRNRGGQDA